MSCDSAPVALTAASSSITMAGKKHFHRLLHQSYTNSSRPQRLPHNIYTPIHSNTAESSNPKDDSLYAQIHSSLFSFFNIKSDNSSTAHDLFWCHSSIVISFRHIPILHSASSSSHTEPEKKKTMPFGIDFMRHPVLYWAAQAHKSTPIQQHNTLSCLVKTPRHTSACWLTGLGFRHT